MDKRVIPLQGEERADINNPQPAIRFYSLFPGHKSMTLYLKYRPQQLADLDLPEVREGLTRMLGSKTWPHAWLFSGPRGTGKTSSARILAKAVNCLARKGAEPCNKCEMCREISEGSAADIIEIDAASNRGIDEIRELREKVRLAPMRATYKVYVIDEVHMLTSEAANALLKTLEEPPDKTIFILCTTEPEKLPETVISRCTRVNYRKPTLQEAAISLKKVAEGEGLKVEDGVLEIIAKAAKGSFRDGTKLLEQVTLNKEEGKKISLGQAQEVLELVQENDPAEMVEKLFKGESEAALANIAAAEARGVNLRTWMERMAETVREKILTNLKDKQIVNQWMDLAEQLNVVYGQIKTAAVPQLPLEILAIKRGKGYQEEPTVGKPVKPDTKPEIKKAESPKESKQVNETDNKKDTVASEKSRVTGKGKFKVEDVAEKWQELLKAVKPKNHSVEALLRSTKPVSFDGEKLTLEVFYKFHKDKLETDKCRSIVEQAVGEVLGISGVKLYLALGKKAGKEEVSAEGVGEDIIAAAEQIFKVEAV